MIRRGVLTATSRTAKRLVNESRKEKQIRLKEKQLSFRKQPKNILLYQLIIREQEDDENTFKTPEQIHFMIFT